MKNYYAILEVPVGSSPEDIRQAYHRLAPENMDNASVFADLQEAHDVLTTPEKRAEYDREAWGQTFKSGAAFVPGSSFGTEATLLPAAPAPAAGAPGGLVRCPMGAPALCPALLGRAAPGDTYCPECGFLLAELTARDQVAFEPAAASDLSREIRLEEPGGAVHRLRPGPNLVGREDTDILLPDKTVSRRHARLEVGADGTVTVEDMGSTNGTQVSGELLVPHVPRQAFAGDRVRFGSVLTELHLPDPAPGQPSIPVQPAPVPAAPPSGGEPRAQVVALRDGEPRIYPLPSGATTFGRRSDNSVVLSGDPYVSGLHAQIVAEGDVWTLTDTGSTNGTLLNGERLAVNAPMILTPGDVVLIGGTALRFERLDLPDESHPDEPGGETPTAEPPERTAPEYDVPEEGAREPLDE